MAYIIIGATTWLAIRLVSADRLPPVTAQAAQTVVPPSPALTAVPASPGPTAAPSPEPTSYPPTWTPTPSPVPTVIPTYLPSPTPTVTPTANPPTETPTRAYPYLVAKVQPGLEVRAGPDADQPIIGFLYPEEEAKILAQTGLGEGRWWLIDYLGQVGWVTGQPGYTAAHNAAEVPLVYPTPTPRPPATTATPTPYLEPARIRFEASRSRIERGECIMVYWHVTGVRAVYYQGRGVAGERQSRTECPTETTYLQLRVIKRDGRAEVRHLKIEVERRW